MPITARCVTLRYANCYVTDSFHNRPDRRSSRRRQGMHLHPRVNRVNSFQFYVRGKSIVAEGIIGRAIIESPSQIAHSWMKSPRSPRLMMTSSATPTGDGPLSHSASLSRRLLQFPPTGCRCPAPFVRTSFSRARESYIFRKFYRMTERRSLRASFSRPNPPSFVAADYYQHNCANGKCAK